MLLSLWLIDSQLSPDDSPTHWQASVCEGFVDIPKARPSLQGPTAITKQLRLPASFLSPLTIGKRRKIV